MLPHWVVGREWASVREVRRPGRPTLLDELEQAAAWTRDLRKPVGPVQWSVPAQKGRSNSSVNKQPPPDHEASTLSDMQRSGCHVERHLASSGQDDGAEHVVEQRQSGF